MVTILMKRIITMIMIKIFHLDKAISFAEQAALHHRNGRHGFCSLIIKIITMLTITITITNTNTIITIIIITIALAWYALSTLVRLE